MFQRFSGAALALALLLPAVAPAQTGFNISGQYVHGVTGGFCLVEQVNQNVYLFTNEKGSHAWFQVTDPRGRLVLINHDGGWYHRMSVTVHADGWGRTTLFFQAPGIPGYRGETWTAAY